MAEPDRRLTEKLAAKLAHQTADLVVKAGLSPADVAQAYLQTALALAIQSGVSPLECAVTLRSLATLLEELDAQDLGGSTQN